MQRKFEIIEHPADVGFIAYGRDLRELLENTAAAMLSLACDPATLGETEQRNIAANGDDAEALLFAWLAEILAICDAENLFFRRVAVTSLKNFCARGTAHGEPYDKSRHRAGTYIKAVTYHQLHVEESPEGWRATVFLDV
jgi:SHS2 domain-containing protein